MLKVKEGIKLKELEKYGFKREYIVSDWCYWKEDKEDDYREILIVWEENREIQAHAIEILDTLYDLIQAGIVVKE